MTNLLDYEIFNKNILSLEEISKDDSDKNNVEYMTNSTLKAVDFDSVKTCYANNLNLSYKVAHSVDAIVFCNHFNIFIEFKNGNMKKEKSAVKNKIRDSLLIFCDITNRNISDTRMESVFILVYNNLKNQSSREYINSHITSKSNQELIRFGVDIFKELYFKEVHTYTESEFEEYLNFIESEIILVD